MINYNKQIYFILLLMVFCASSCNGQIGKKRELTTAPYNKEVIAENLQSDSSKYNQYQDNQRHGIWQEYYKSGVLKSEGNYLKGVKDGICREWWKNGNLWTEGVYKDDISNGWMKWYNEEGILVAEGNMINDKRDGKWRICDFELVKNCIEANFNEGKKTGIWKILHGNGNVWKEQEWDDGNMISQKCWDENGVKIECKFTTNSNDPM